MLVGAGFPSSAKRHWCAMGGAAFLLKVLGIFVVNPIPASDMPTSISLAREVDRWGVLALTVNCVVGAGILGLPGRIFALAGSETNWILAGAALLAAAAALCLAELGSRFDGAGGPIEYCSDTLGRSAGFAVGCLLWTATVLGAASLLNLFSGLIAPDHRILTVVCSGAGLTLVAMARIAKSAAVSTALTVLKLALLIGFVSVGLASPAAPAVISTHAPDPAKALVLLFFAFVGFERPTAVAGEVKDARWAVPFALLTGMAIVALLYAGVFAACLRGVPNLATSEQPVRDLATRLSGGLGAGMLSWAAALIVAGTLSTQWITAPRALLALAQRGQMPAGLARLSVKRQTPDLAIATTGLLAVLLALPGDFAGTVAASSASRLVIFILCAAALLKLRRMSDAPRARLLLPGGAPLAICVMATCSALLLGTIAEFARVGGILILGAVLWLATTRISRTVT